MTDLAKRLEELAEKAAESVCHREQMIIWSGEVAGALSLGGFLREDLSYDDGLDLHAAIKSEIRRIVASAIGHPEALPTIISALEAREGMVLVPVEPTKEMMRAFWLAGPYPLKPFVDGYRAMIAAAPKEPRP